MRKVRAPATSAVATAEASPAPVRTAEPRGLAAIVGKWPGDETDEQVAAALNDMRGGGAAQRLARDLERLRDRIKDPEGRLHPETALGYWRGIALAVRVNLTDLAAAFRGSAGEAQEPEPHFDCDVCHEKNHPSRAACWNCKAPRPAVPAATAPPPDLAPDSGSHSDTDSARSSTAGPGESNCSPLTTVHAPPRGVQEGGTSSATAAQLRRHSTKENGDCPSWCEACLEEAKERAAAPLGADQREGQEVKLVRRSPVGTRDYFDGMGAAAGLAEKLRDRLIVERGAVDAREDFREGDRITRAALVLENFAAELRALSVPSQAPGENHDA